MLQLTNDYLVYLFQLQIDLNHIRCNYTVCNNKLQYGTGCSNNYDYPSSDAGFAPLLNATNISFINGLEIDRFIFDCIGCTDDHTANVSGR